MFSRLNLLVGFVGLVGLSVMGTACAPASRQGELSVANFDAIENAAVKGASSPGSNGQWRCPGAPNVRVKSDFIYNGSLDYTVCVDERDGGHFLIQGYTSGAQCIFPMLSSASGQSTNIADNGQCVVLQNGRAEVRFSNQSINFMVISDYNVVGQMTSCLTGATACPVHSEGYVK